MKNKKLCYSCKYYNKIKNRCNAFVQIAFISNECDLYRKREKYNRSAKEDRTCDGIVFDSKKEMKRYLVLKLLEKNREIQNLELQPVIELQESFKYDGKTIRAIQYKADFLYYENGKMIYEDVKGMRTKEYIIKKKLLLKKLLNEPNVIFKET